MDALSPITPAAFARGGDDLVIDELVLAPGWAGGWTTLSGIEGLLVCVTCSLEGRRAVSAQAGSPVGLPEAICARSMLTAPSRHWSSTP